MNRFQSGFSLIQGVIIVAVVGALGLVAVPKYEAFVTKSQLTEALNIAHESKRKLEMYYMTTGRFPQNMREAEAMKTDTLKAPEYVQDMQVFAPEMDNDVVVKVFIKEGVAENLAGVAQYLYIAGNQTSGANARVEWTCGAQGIDEKLLPDNCKG